MGTGALPSRPICRLKKSTGVFTGPSDVPGARRRLDAAKREDALALQEELALLREEQAEAREVDLLVVVFDLREVGAIGEVRGQAARDAVLHVHAGVAVQVGLEASGPRRGRPWPAPSA